MTAGAASKEFRHDMPDDLAAVLHSRPDLDAMWQALTDLGRNEWICWMTSPKTEATRVKRLARLIEELGDGKRRPCCWPGCPHRLESARKWVDA